MNDAKPHILVVDDELPILRVLKPSFAAAGYDVVEANTGREALTRVGQQIPDVILLDLGLPDMDGKDVILALRKWTQVPIIVLSAREAEAERIAALDAGADDYVVKPFLTGELLARLRAALRHRHSRAEATHYSGNGLEINFESRRVAIGGMEVRLTRKEYDLLRTLARHAGQVVTHKQLLAAAWGGTVTDTQFVRVYIGQVRQKIEREPSNPRLILTEAGIGYRLATD
ncbi:MAG: response regulator transcription factor [Proteobacteria bacterium]|nr:response regulator transcription factor [Pseudomonadota bacterium]